MRASIVVIATFIFLAISASTFAEDSDPAATPPAPQLANGHGNNCASEYYPAEAVRLGEEGPTTVNVHIDTTGKPTGVDIAASSGFAVLDQAARDCVMAKWHFLPATMNGKPVASSKLYRIVWKLNGDTSPPHLAAPMEVSCADIFTDAKPRWTAYQSAVLQFRISATGGVIFPTVATSSGDTLFDAKAVQCATRLKYNAAVINDVATEISWNAAVRWSPRTGLAYTDSYHSAPYCPDDGFPPDIWNGDPPNGTVISFHIVQDGAVAGAAIEQSSGNPALDQAALKCIESWHNPYASLLSPSPDVADVVRFSWRRGHAFAMDDTWK